MSVVTSPEADTGSVAFIPLEANPDLMTALVHKLGVSSALALHDLYSLTDVELLAFVPRPALSLLLVFPVSAAYESHRMAEDSLADDYKGRGPHEPAIWWKQTIRNACGLMGVLHAVSNGPARVYIEGGSTLDELLKKSVDLAPAERSRLLESTPAIAEAHREAASGGDTAAPDANSDVDLHYVCFTKGGDGNLWELDGRRKGPIKRGELGEKEDILSSKALSMGPLKFLEREGADLRFSAVVLAPSVE